jgi:PAS domain S-box-containing protein
LVPLLALVLLGIGVVGERLNDERYALAARAEALQRLGELRDRLNNLLLSDLQLVRGLVSVINLHPQLDQAHFEQAVQPLFDGRTHLRNVAAAPGMIIRLMVPLAGNEKAIGLDYRHTPAQAEAAERARITRQIVLAGPLPLVQGGVGLIARLPVYLHAPEGDSFWGLVSAVIDSDTMFHDAGLLDPTLPIAVAIRGADATGPEGKPFLGNHAVFDGQPVTIDLDLPQGAWQLAAIPVGGWPRHAPLYALLRLGYASVAALVLGAFVVLTRALQRASVARERAEGAQRQLLAVLEGAPDAMLLIDDRGHIVQANPQAERLFGWPREQLTGLPLATLVPPNASSPAAMSGPQGFVAAAAAERDRHVEGRGQRADGQYFPVELSLSPLLMDDRPLVAAAIRDVSVRKEVEAELERYRTQLEAKVEQRTAQLAAAKDAAEAASVAKSQFLANMSHEIRTPLNAITGMAYLIRRAGVSPQQAMRLDSLEAASRHLLQVINGILDLAKIESGHLELVREPVQPQRIVHDVVTMLHDTVQAKGLQVLTDVQVPAQPLMGDATRLQQALLNYTANAVRFTAAGQVLVRVRVEAEEEARLCVCFEVLDTGIGIDPKTLARLFTAFEQADNTSTRSHGGTGLGLVITRRLAQQMGGEAGAESTPGQGSRFWFTAWLDKAGVDAVVPPVPADAAQAASQPRCVLLVEDDGVNRTIASFLLADLGHRVDVAEDGVQAVVMAQATPYDLILMDMQMPRMDGLEATRRIRSWPGHVHTPIIAITANAFEQDRDACLAAGMDDFVSKPIMPDVLREVLGRWLQPQARHVASA